MLKHLLSNDAVLAFERVAGAHDLNGVDIDTGAVIPTIEDVERILGIKIDIQPPMRLPGKEH